MARQSVQILTKAYAPDHWRTAMSKSILGANLSGLQRYAEAEPLLIESLSVVENARNASRRTVRGVTQRVVDFYDAWDKPEKAAEFRALLQETEQDPQ